MIPAARDYLWTSLVADEPEPGARDGRQPGARDGRQGYGSVAMDMFAPSQWAPVDTVRARSWHDVHLDAEPAPDAGRSRRR
jgi:hypothetical protein